MKNLIDEYWGDNPRIETHKKKMWNPPDTYLDAQSILTDELIRIGHKDRTFSMEEFLEVIRILMNYLYLISDYKKLAL